VVVNRLPVTVGLVATSGLSRVLVGVMVCAERLAVTRGGTSGLCLDLKKGSMEAPKVEGLRMK
jgi:hypothetical protein